MEKPTVFISHSAVDRDFILQLNKLIRECTSETIELFQSSDGESIPFGNNWVHQVEENLNKSKVMFVFVSPRSAMSSWIYFEAGFAYSKGIKVIPIGIGGVDIGALKPPLNLLQGFNISSSEGLNNIIAVLNKEFNCKFRASFTAEDYERLSAFSFDMNTSSSRALAVIDHVHLIFPNQMGRDGNKFQIVQQPLSQVEKLLIANEIEYRNVDKSTIFTHGMVISYKEGQDYESGVSLVIDPFCLNLNEGLINSLVKELYSGEKLDKHWFYVFFEEEFSLITTNFKLSSRLHIHGFSMSDLNGRMHRYKSLDFTIDPASESHRRLGNGRENLRVVYDAGQFNADLLCSLIEELLRAGVISRPKTLLK